MEETITVYKWKSDGEESWKESIGFILKSDILKLINKPIEDLANKRVIICSNPYDKAPYCRATKGLCKCYSSYT